MAGNSIFKKEAGLVITSIANNANYIATFQGGSEGVRLFDKQGNVVLQGESNDLTLVSGDGTKGILWDINGVKIYNLSEEMGRFYFFDNRIEYDRLCSCRG